MGFPVNWMKHLFYRKSLLNLEFLMVRTWQIPSWGFPRTSISHMAMKSQKKEYSGILNTHISHIRSYRLTWKGTKCDGFGDFFFCRFLCGIPILHYAFRSLIPRESDVIWCQKRFTGVHWQISSVFGCHFCWFRFEYAEPLVYRKSIFRDFRGMIQCSIKLPHWGLKPAKEVQVMIVFSNGKSIQIEHLKAFKCF